MRSYPRRGLHGDAVHRLGIRIVGGDLAAGELLPNENALALELDVSRSVLRETIKVLAGKGLVEVRPKTGTRVCAREMWNLLDPDVLNWQLDGEVDRRFFQDLIQLRAIIEPAAARLAAGAVTRAEIAALERFYAEMEASIDDPVAYTEADLRFHDAIVEACRNELLEQMVKMLRSAFRAGRELTTTIRGLAADTLPQHRAVLDAIVRRDAAGAEAAMLTLLERGAHDVDQAIRQASRRARRSRRVRA